MPYGTPLTEAERIDKHISIYGEMPPETRLGIPQGINTLEIDENLKLIILVGGIAGAWIFLDFILPSLVDK